MTLTERILRKIHAQYVGGGIEAIAANLGKDVLRPRRKVTVMIVGNHGAGKSSFINWYAERHVQGTGVAVESQGFTVISSGKKDEDAPIRGRAMLEHPNYKHLTTLPEVFGASILDSVELRVSSSQAKDFALVDFVDTPGCVDGNVEYPFDVNNVMKYFADHSDLIFVYLDPIGQALCKRTMDVVSLLTENNHNSKMRYYLTKADTIEKASDLTKVIVQVTQNLVGHIKNTNAFNVPAIFLPGKGDDDDEGAGALTGSTKSTRLSRI